VDEEAVGVVAVEGSGGGRWDGRRGLFAGESDVEEDAESAAETSFGNN
jgi:hypothetical protein